VAWPPTPSGRKLPDTLRRLDWPLLQILALMLLAILASAWISRATYTAPNLSRLNQQITGLKQAIRQAAIKANEDEALLAIRDSQIETMKRELREQQSKIAAMRQRLALFEDVLAERKVTGIHFLRPEATWLQGAIHYRLVIVKGGNRPRWVNGKLQFELRDDHGHTLTLEPMKRKKSGYRIEMQEQTFIEGELPWHQTWRPNRITIRLVSRDRRSRGEITIPITDQPARSTP